MRQRIKRIFSLSESRIPELRKGRLKLDAIAIMNYIEPSVDLSFFYVSGMVDGTFELANALLWPDGSTHVIAHALEETTARSGKFGLSIFQTMKENNEHLKEQLKGATCIGINADELTHGNFLRLKQNCARGAKFIDIGPAIKSARAVKDADELRTLGKACRIVSKIAEDIPDCLSEGAREYELGAELSYRMQKKGANRPSFTLVAFGAKTAEPHYMGGARKLKTDQFIILDFGAVYHKYHSDITRTYYKGRISAKARELYAHAARAQEVALEQIHAGANARVVHESVVEYVNGTKYKGLFPHATGHTIGLSVHDGERLYNWDLTLEENMVFTVEPGLYIPGYGGCRVEDDIVVTKNGYRFLTDASRELVEV